MDPIQVFPIEIIELILQHLTVNNLLTASELSPLWNKTICGYSNFIEKATIQILDHNISPHKDTLDWNNLKYLSVPSLRKYQNIHFTAKPEIIDDIKTILAVPGSEWKKVYIDGKLLNGNINSFRGKWLNDYYDIFLIIEKDVEVLHLDTSSFKIWSSVRPSFANLKVLRLTFFCMSENTFKHCRQLEELSVMIVPSNLVGSVKHIIEHNNLSVMEISENVFMSLFEHSCDISHLKLKTFYVDSVWDNSVYEQVHVNFSNFLKSQEQSLEQLSVKIWMGQDVFMQMFDLPNLKTLSVTVISSRWFEPNIRVNPSIKSLCFLGKHINFDIMKALVDATPNLTHLKMHSMHQNMMEYLSANLKHLKSLELRCLDATDFSDRKLFSHLEKLSISIVTSAKEDEMLKIPLNERNRFVELLLESDYTMLH